MTYHDESRCNMNSLTLSLPSTLMQKDLGSSLDEAWKKADHDAETIGIPRRITPLANPSRKKTGGAMKSENTVQSTS